jgi:hypothetical protein
MPSKKSDANIKADFMEWSGGFPPESPEQITVYIDYAIAIDADPDAERDLLLAWMEEPPAAPQK